jgi:hypothetical protein
VFALLRSASALCRNLFARLWIGPGIACLRFYRLVVGLSLIHDAVVLPSSRVIPEHSVFLLLLLLLLLPFLSERGREGEREKICVL